MSDELIERLRAELGLPISELRNIHAAAEAVNLAFDRHNDEDEKKLRGEPHDMSYAQHEIDRATAKYEEVAFTRSVQSLGLEVCLSRLEKAAARITALEAENKRLREALLDVLSHLVAAESLLFRGGKSAAPSDKMFDIMLQDYRNSIERGRAVAAELEKK